jgi:hypothetical protein
VKRNKQILYTFFSFVVAVFIEFSASAQYTDSIIVLGSKCNAYRLVTFPISQEYCFYKEYLGDRLVETGYLIEAAGKKKREEAHKDSLITTYDNYGRISRLRKIKLFKTYVDKVYENGELVKSRNLYKTRQYADSIVEELFLKGKLIETRIENFNAVVVITHDSRDSIIYNKEKYGSTLERKIISGDTIISEYYTTDYKLIAKKKSINMLDIYENFFSELIERRISGKYDNTNIDVIIVPGKSELSWNRKSRTLLFDIKDTIYGHLEGYGTQVDSRKKLEIHTEKGDSIFFSYRGKDTLWLEIRKADGTKVKQAFIARENGLRKFEGSMNERYTDEILEVVKMCTENIHLLELPYWHEIKFYRDKSIQSFSSWISGKKMAYVFKPGKVSENTVEEKVPLIQKDIKSCLWGVLLNNKWLLEPKFEEIEIINYPLISVENIFYQCNTIDSGFVYNSAGQKIISEQKFNHIALIHPDKILSNTLQNNDSSWIMIWWHTGISYYTLNGKELYHYRCINCSITEMNPIAFIVRLGNKSIIQKFDGNNWEINSEKEFAFVSSTIDLVYETRDYDQPQFPYLRSIYSNKGFVTNFFHIHYNNRKPSIIITDSALLEYSKANQQIRFITKINHAYYPSPLLDDQRTNQSIVVVSLNHKQGLFDLYRRKYIQPPTFDSVSLYWHHFLKNNKWGIFNADFTKVLFSGYDQITPFKSEINQQVTYILKSGNLSYLANKNGKILFKQGFDQVALLYQAQVTLFLLNGKILTQLSNKFNHAPFSEKLKNRLLWVASLVYGAKTDYVDGLVDHDSVIVPLNYNLSPINNYIEMLNPLKDYPLAFELQKDDQKYNYSYADGLKNLSDDYKFTGSIENYQMGIDKNGQIVSRSCDWSPNIPKGSTKIALSRGNLLWTTTALPKDSVDFHFSDGKWNITILKTNVQHPDTFMSPFNHIYNTSGNFHVIQDHDSNWNVYNYLLKKINLEPFKTFRIKENQSYGNQFYFQNEKGCYYFRPWSEYREAGFEKIRDLNTIKYGEHFFSFDNDTLWIQDRADQTLQYDVNFFFNKINISEMNNPYKNKWTVSTYLSSLEQIQQIYMRTYSNDYNYYSTPDVFPPNSYYFKPIEDEVVSDDMVPSPDEFVGYELNPDAQYSDIKIHKPLPLKFLDFYTYPITFRNLDDYTSRLINIKLSSFKINHLFLSKAGIFYKHDLYTIIDSSQIIAFNNFLFNKLSNYKGLNFPCLPNSDFMKYFNPNFELHEREIILRNLDRNQFHFTIKELMPFLNDWAKNNIFAEKR